MANNTKLDKLTINKTNESPQDFQANMFNAATGTSSNNDYDYDYDDLYGYLLDEVVVTAPPPTPPPHLPPLPPWFPGNPGFGGDGYGYGYDGYGYGYGYDDGGGGSGGGSTGNPSPPQPQPPSGGVNPNNFTFQNIQGNFRTQLNRILQSNRVIGSILALFDRGVVRMIFRMEELRPGAAAHMNFVSQEVYHMVFSTRYFDHNGWITGRIASCNVGFDWSQATTPEQKLVVILAHEALHAKHRAFYDMALRVAENDGHVGSARVYPAVNWLRMEGFSDDFINIWFVRNPNAGNRWEFRQGDRTELMDNYIRDHNQDTLRDALNQFKNQFPGR